MNSQAYKYYSIKATFIHTRYTLTPIYIQSFVIKYLPQYNREQRLKTNNTNQQLYQQNLYGVICRPVITDRIDTSYH